MDSDSPPRSSTDAPPRSSTDAPPRSSTDAPPRFATDAEATSSGSKAPKRPTVRRIGKRVANLAAGTKFTVKFDYAHQPVGEYKPDYVTRQGVVVRNAHITSLAYKSWHKVPHEMKQKMMDAVLISICQFANLRKLTYLTIGTMDLLVLTVELQDKFEIGDFAERLDLLEKSLGKKWKDYRAELKYHYWTDSVLDEVNLRNIPPGVSEADWTWLVQYWGQEEVQELCRKNKEHRNVQQMHHRTGRKSFAVTADNEDEINELLAARDQGLNSLADDEIFMQVFGEERPGRVRCMGPDHTLTSRWGRRPSRVDFERDREERRKQNEKIARRLEMADAHQAQLEAHQAQIEARLEAQFEDRIRHMQAAHDEQMRRMMDEFSRRMMHTTNEQQPPS